MIYVIILSLIAGALGLYYLLFKDSNVFKKHKIPYMKSSSLLTNITWLIFPRLPVTDIITSIYNVHPYAKYVGMFDFTRPIVMLRDPELIKSITSKHFDAFPDHRTLIEENQDPLFGKNLFFLRGDRWRQVRSVVSPTFTSSKMKNMFKLMSDCAAEFSNYLAQLPPEQQMMEIKDAFMRYTTDAIATCAFGVKVHSMKHPNNEFYIYGKEATSFNNTAILKLHIFKNLPWLARLIKLRFIREEIANFFRNVIKTTIKTRDENGIIRPDILQLMMENRSKEHKVELNIDDMVAQAFIFFFGGFESTSTLMCFAAHEIAMNQDIQKRLQNEIDQVLENTNGQASYEAVNDMEYLDAVINEALRMYPIAPNIDRLCVKDFELEPALPWLKPYTIKKGQEIMLPFYALHHDPRYFKKPEKFDPERFLGERKNTTLNSGAYMPFGMGPRMCIGNRFALLEIKVLFFQLLARCNLEICEKTPIPLKFAKGFNMQPESGFWLSVVPRKNTHRTITANVNEIRQ